MAEESRKIRILVADDHEVVRKGLELVLKLEEGFEVVGAVGTGRAAIEYATRDQPDLLLLDLMMPEPDGVAVTRAVKQSAPQTQVLILTGHGASPLLADALNAGADGYILKDVSPQELFRAIRVVAQGEAYLQPVVTRRLFRLLQPGPRLRLRGGSLTQRELEILRLMATAHTTREIADRLSIGVETVRTHVKNILHKLGTPNRTQAVLAALRQGLIEL